MQRGTFHPRHKFDHTGLADIHDQAIDDLVSQIAVRHLPALETKARLDLVAFREEAYSLILLGHVVMLIDGDGELHLFDHDDLLRLAGRTLALVLLVQELSIILDLAHGRHGIGRDLHQIERALAGDLERLKRLHDAELCAILVNDAHFTGTDTVIGTDEGLLGTLVVERWDGQPPDPLKRILYLDDRSAPDDRMSGAQHTLAYHHLRSDPVLSLLPLRPAVPCKPDDAFCRSPPSFEILRLRRSRKPANMRRRSGAARAPPPRKLPAASPEGDQSLAEAPCPAC